MSVRKGYRYGEGEKKIAIRRGYKFGVEWIAHNDDPLVMDIDHVAAFISVLLLADLFGREPRDVAIAVVTERRMDPDRSRGSLPNGDGEAG